MYKVFFITFGCKVNQYETECMKADLLSKGFESAESADVADVIILNSCTVTSSGDSKSLYALRKLRKDRPDALIVLTGCLPQASPEIADSIPEADIIAGTKNRNLLSGMILEFLEHRKRIVEIARYGASDSFEDLVHGDFTGKTRAFVKIQDGCNQFCSYCIIPFARGRCRSKPLEVLRDELKMLADAGHREIVLVGINLAFYGMEYGLRLADAVEECCHISGNNFGFKRTKTNTFNSGDMAKAREYQLYSVEIVKVIVKYGGGVRGGKAIMNLLGIPCGECRAPMHKFTPEEYENLRKDLEAIGFFEKI